MYVHFRTSFTPVQRSPVFVQCVASKSMYCRLLRGIQWRCFCTPPPPSSPQLFARSFAFPPTPLPSSSQSLNCFLPGSLLHARYIARQRIHSEIVLRKVSVSHHDLPKHSQHSIAAQIPPIRSHTLVILKSLNTPLPLPPSTHRFLICVGRV
jgi:hypothetical protein